MHARDRIWHALREARANGLAPTFDDLYLAVRRHGVSPQQLRIFLSALTAAGYVRGPSWSLVRDVGPHTPQLVASGRPRWLGQGRQRLWTALRALRTGAPQDIAHAASDETIVIAGGTAATYLDALTRAGYCARRVVARGRSEYTLLRSHDTGPRCPLLIEHGAVMLDQNTGARHRLRRRGDEPAEVRA